MSTTATGTQDRFRERLGRVGVWLGLLGTRSAEEERAAAAEIEELGYGALWFGESPAYKEAFAHAAILLASTRRIVVATGIANIYVRDPLAMTSAAHALAEAYPGRFVLGMGVSHAPLVERRGHHYGRPLAAMRDYLDGMNRARYAPPDPAEPLARVLAALKPKMLGLARDRADGAHTYLVTPRHTARARDVLGDGPVLAPELAMVLQTDPERARVVAREHLATYLTLPNYLNNLGEEGFDDRDFADGGSDRLVDALVAWGDADAIADRVRRHLEAGADHVAVHPVTKDLGEAMSELRALAPTLLDPMAQAA
jgi:probable F420-dependent oxidoreductase